MLMDSCIFHYSQHTVPRACVRCASASRGDFDKVENSMTLTELQETDWYLAAQIATMSTIVGFSRDENEPDIYVT